MTVSESLCARAQAWRGADPDPKTRTEVDELLMRGDSAGLAERFDGALAFGTAGIRAEVGAGPMRMNRLVVGRVAAGLARYITTNDPQAASAGVVIGYDGRTNSSVFAEDAARVLAREGVKVSMLPGPLPTPVLAFAVRHCQAAYGVMVTASHNPRQYNGLKVYVRDGAQLLPPLDGEIAAVIDAVDPLHLPTGWETGPFEFVPADSAVDAYVAAVAARGRPAPGARPPKVVYTALHGVGDGTFRAALAAAGWPEPVLVGTQEKPDATFPTLPYPNPEEPGVLDLARQTADEVSAGLVLATDPDADRLAVMLPGPGGWQVLTGDELGALLGDAILARLDRGEPVSDPGGRPPVVATSVVSGSLLRRLAQAAGVRCVTTLTGFKWVARAAGEGGALVFGYEQAIGYSVRPELVADKDGISTALLVLQLVTEEAARGRTLLDRLADLAVDHGVHVTGMRVIKAVDGGGLDRLAAAVQRVRDKPLEQLAGYPVAVTDLLKSTAAAVDLAGGLAERAPGEPVPPADVLVWHAGPEARVMIRPSGTEPELKLYAEVVKPVGSREAYASARDDAIHQAEQMLAVTAMAMGLGAEGGSQ